MTKYDLLYIGPKPPPSYDGLDAMAKDLIDDDLLARKTEAEKDSGVECFLVVRSGVITFTWNKPGPPPPIPEPKPPTTKQQIMIQIDVMKQLADQLP